MTVPEPSERRLLDERQPPTSAAVGYQRWAELLFLHWLVEPQRVQATLPPGLRVDTWRGRAFVGVVPFFMERIRPAFLPPVPGLSWFHELNVRTYVVDAAGRPGVWFYSLDCDQPIAVWLARRLFHLPYRHAMFRSRRTDGAIAYECEVTGQASAHRFEWKRPDTGTENVPGSLEFFLLERYRLFSADARGNLHSGRVHHAPYRVSVPVLGSISAGVAGSSGFDVEGPPVSALAAASVDVSVHRLQPVH